MLLQPFRLLGECLNPSPDKKTLEYLDNTEFFKHKSEIIKILKQRT